jgi:diguanylate cyclase (GGDEF)-like protein/putative nucleotidyltransferase with HDIG domain/PAS domain S-box-containing protein
LFKDGQYGFLLKNFMDEENNALLFSKEGAEKIFKKLIETMSQGVIVVNKEGIITFYNKRVPEMFACKKANLLYEKLYEVFDFTGKNSSLLCTCSGTETKEFSTVNFSNRKLNMLADVSPITADSGKPEYFLITLSDITSRIKSEQKLKRAITNLKKLSIVDGLTGLYNPRYFKQRLSQEAERSLRYNSPLSLLMMDMDLFKIFNDMYGHCFGDYMLKKISLLFKNNCRASDVVFRYGGDEFCILLTDTDYEGAFAFSEKIRQIIKEERFSFEKKSAKTTVSLGISSLLSDCLGDKEKLVEFADRAMMFSKKIGGNKTTCFRDINTDANGASKDAYDSDHALESLLYQKDSFHFPESILTLVRALETKDSYCEKHSIKVMNYAYLTAKKMNLSCIDQEIIKNAALMHDVGKIGIRDSILLKEGSLTHAEVNEVRKHPEIGVKMLRPLQFLKKSIPCILYHHEWYNGKGYPNGLAKNDIPLGAQIIAVADSFDAMTSKRPYRQAMDMHAAISELVNCSGTQFSPEIVGSFLAVFKEKNDLIAFPEIDSAIEDLRSSKDMHIYS